LAGYTVGTATDANAMLRILFSRLGQPHIGSANAFPFNVPSVRPSGAITIERGAGKTVRRTLTRTGGMCPPRRARAVLVARTIAPESPTLTQKEVVMDQHG
jgi:hypothetical protein